VAMLAALLWLLVSCAGVPSSGTKKSNQLAGTPKGTYAVTVNVVSGTLAHNMSAMVNVQ
jgi:hypothetical protein